MPHELELAVLLMYEKLTNMDYMQKKQRVCVPLAPLPKDPEENYPVVIFNGNKKTGQNIVH